MHGFVTRGIELFLRARHGDSVWTAAAASAGVDRRGMQIVRIYPPEVAEALIRAAAFSLQITPEELLEDIGGWIAGIESMRNMLRFSGSCFEDFVLSLDDLHDRGSVVLPGLDLPRITTLQSRPGHFHLSLLCDDPAWYHVLAGLLRGMADDYGALAIVDGDGASLKVEVADASFAQASLFSMTNEIASC